MKGKYKNRYKLVAKTSKTNIKIQTELFTLGFYWASGSTELKYINEGIVFWIDGYSFAKSSLDYTSVPEDKTYKQINIKQLKKIVIKKRLESFKNIKI